LKNRHCAPLAPTSLALSLLAAGALAAPASALDLVKGGQPVTTIVLPLETEYDGVLKTAAPDIQARAKTIGDEELLAAEELQSIIEKISGAKLAIERSATPPTKPSILIGTSLARQAGFGGRVDKLDKDGLLCAVKGNSLVLSGKRARGTLYAAYELLEELGCRWVMPGAFGELYPSLKTISTNVNKAENPSHTQRYWWCTYGDAPGYARWTLRNKGNFVKALGDFTVAQGHALSGPLGWAKTQEKYAVKTKVGDKDVLVLPDEYYAISDGKPTTMNPNFSNPKVWDMYADYYIDFFKKHPHENYVSISAEDGLVIDERPASRALDSDDYDWMAGANSSTDKLWYFHNQVMDRVAKVFPDKKFGVLVYANNMMPPKKSKVHRNMALVFAPLTVCPLHHVRDEKCKTNRTYSKWLVEWLRQAKVAGAESFYYDYEPLGFSWNVAMICPRWGIIGKNYPWFAEMGLTGHTTQGHDDWASAGLDNYLMQQLYWNAKLNYKDVIADYAKARFGKAAPAMIEYYNVYEKRMDVIPDLYQNEVWANYLVLDPPTRKAAREHLARALTLADTDRAKAHLQTMVELQRSTDAACEAEEEARTTGDFGKAVQLMEPVWDVREKLNALYPKFMNPDRTNKKETAQYLTGGFYNQYIGFDKKIKGAAASMVLPRFWKGKLDTDNKAEGLGYYKSEVSVAALEDLDSSVLPDVKYGTEREPAAFFYRTEMEVPANFAGKKINLFFASVIANEMKIWINGQPVEFTQKDKKSMTWQGPAYFWVDYNHAVEFDVTPYIKVGQKNTIAIRVFKKYDIGGMYRRVYLLGQ